MLCLTDLVQTLILAINRGSDQIQTSKPISLDLGQMLTLVYNHYMWLPPFRVKSSNHKQ